MKKIILKVRHNKELASIAIPKEYDKLDTVIPVSKQVERVTVKRTESHNIYTFYKVITEEYELSSVKEGVKLIDDWFKGNHKNQILSIRVETSEKVAQIKDKSFIPYIERALKKKYEGTITRKFTEDIEFFHETFVETLVETATEGIDMLWDYFTDD